MAKKKDKQVVDDDRLQAWAVWLLRASFAVAAVVAALSSSWETAFISLLALLLTGLPVAIKHKFRLDLPIEYELVLVVFIYMSMFLGNIGGAYEKFWWWDVMLHISSSMVLAFVGLLLLYSLYSRQKLKASPALIAVFAFSFALAIGVLWEIFEFGVDSVFGLNMQRSGLRDTMSDLIVDALGALVVANIAYRHASDGDNEGWTAKLLHSLRPKKFKLGAKGVRARYE